MTCGVGAHVCRRISLKIICENMEHFTSIILSKLLETAAIKQSKIMRRVFLLLSQIKL